MKVILMKDEKKLGKKGDVIKVAEGYARNFLIPRGIAMEATKKNLQVLKQQKTAEVNRQKQAEAKALELKEKIEETTITIKMKAGENGKLFGSVTTKDIADTLSRKKIKVDKRKVELKEPIRNVGTYTVSVRVYKETLANLQVEVIAE